MKKNFSEENAEQKELNPAAEESAEKTPAEQDAETSAETAAEDTDAAQESAQPEEKAEEGQEDKPEKEKTHKDHRKLRYGTIATVMSVVVIAAVVLLNVVVGVLDDRFPLTLDLTKDSLFTLSEQSQEIAKNVKTDVEIVVFMPEEMFAASTGSEQFDTVLRQFTQGVRSYESLSGGRVKTSYVDLSSNPLLAEDYEKYSITSGSILFRSVPEEGSGLSEKYRVATLNDLYTEDTSNYYYTGEISYSSNVEQILAKNINAVSNPNNLKAIMLTGHGESESTVSVLTSLLQENGYELETVNPSTAEEFSEEAVTMFIPAPTIDYTADELEKIRVWLENEQDGVNRLGRNLMLLVGQTAQCPELYDFVNTYYGIEITDNVVVETTSGRYVTSPYYPLADIVSSDFTESLTSSIAFAPLTRQLILHETSNTEDAALTNHSLMSFPESAQLLELSTIEDSESDERTPFEADSYPIVGMAYANQYAYDNTGDYPERVETNVLVCGSEMLLLMNMPTVANESLLLQSINGISGNEDAVTISALSLDQDTLVFSNLSQSILFGIFVVAVPLILMVICLVEFLKRRHL